MFWFLDEGWEGKEEEVRLQADPFKWDFSYLLRRAAPKLFCFELSIFVWLVFIVASLCLKHCIDE